MVCLEMVIADNFYLLSHVNTHTLNRVEETSAEEQSSSDADETDHGTEKENDDNEEERKKVRFKKDSVRRIPSESD